MPTTPTTTGTVVTGCMNPAATNFNRNATVSSGICNFNPTTDTGTGNTGDEISFFILPKATITQGATNTGTPVVAKPSSKFFITPSPKKPTTKESVDTLKKEVEKKTPSKITAIKEIPTSCESNMVDIYSYAKANELVDE